MNWKPIETAPKDGTVVIVSEEPFPQFIGSASYQDGMWWWEDEKHPAFPSLWVELPNPPIPAEYKWQYVCHNCGHIWFYRKEKPIETDDIADGWIGGAYQNTVPLKPTDKKSCPNCGCGDMRLENFKPRDDAITHP